MDKVSFKTSFRATGELENVAVLIQKLSQMIKEAASEVVFEDFSIGGLSTAPDEDFDRTRGKAELSIDILGLGAAPHNSLRRVGIETIGDLCNQSVADLLAIPNLGQSGLLQILDALMRRGMLLKPS